MAPDRGRRLGMGWNLRCPLHLKRRDDALGLRGEGRASHSTWDRPGVLAHEEPGKDGPGDRVPDGRIDPPGLPMPNGRPSRTALAAERPHLLRLRPDLLDKGAEALLTSGLRMGLKHSNLLLGHGDAPAPEPRLLWRVPDVCHVTTGVVLASQPGCQVHHCPVQRLKRRLLRGRASSRQGSPRARLA